MARTLLLITTLLCLFSVPAFSQCGLFYDGFESGNWSPTWSLVSGTYTTSATTTNPAVGTYCLENTGSGGHLSGYSATFANGQPTSVSWYVRYDATTSSGAYFLIGDASMTASNNVAFCYIQGGSNIRFYNGSGLNTPCSANTWYHIEMRNIDYVNRRYDIYINNTLIQANYAFRSSTMSSVDRIYLYNLGNMTGYYDDIVVGGTPISLTGAISDVNCVGDSTGSVAVTPVGGSPQYSYAWNTGGTTSSLSNLAAGSYTVTVTDSLGCTGVDSFQVGSPSAITTSIAGTNLICNGDSSGSIDLSPSGGTPSYTYLWSNGGSTQDLTNVPAGNYTVTLTDSLGCTHLDSITVTEPAAIAATFTTSQPFCNGDSTGSVSLVATGGTPSYSYLWSTGDMTQSISGLAASSYLVTVTDTLGCTHLDSVTLTEPAVISTAISVSDLLCNGDSTGAISLSPTGGTPGYSYLWSTGDMTQSISGLAASSYMVTVTDSLGCTTIDSGTVLEPTALSSSGVVTDAVTPPGNNGAIDLTVAGGTPGYSYMWSNNATTEDINGLSPGTYSVVVTDSNGCTWTDTFTVGSMVGTENLLNDFGLWAYPNPGNGDFNIVIDQSSASDAILTLYDLQGRLVRKQQLNLISGENKIRLDLSQEANGIYQLRIQHESGSAYLKLIKQ